MKTWRMTNTGTTTWGAGYTLEFRGGHDFKAGVATVPALEPGQSGDIRLPLRIPGGLAPGQYRGDWQLRTPSGQYFGDTIWYALRIGGSGGGNGTGGGTLELRVAPGEVFSPSISVVAPAGGLSAGSGDMLRHDGPVEQRFGAFQHVAVRGSIAAGAAYQFTINDPAMRASTTPGTYTSVWRLWVRGAYVGQPYTLKIIVGAGSSQPSAPPNRPTALTPTDLSVFVAKQPRLCARANGDPENNPVEEFYFETFESAHLWASGWVRADCVDTSGLPPANYQWRVKVRDSTGAVSDWSERLRFTLDSDQVTITNFSFSPPSPSAVDTVIVRGATAGCAGSIGGLRVFVNTAADGSDRGDWVPIVGELGVAAYNDVDAPRWDTLEWESGTHLVRLQARSCDTAGTVRVRDLPYTLQHRRPSRPFLITPIDGAWTNRREVTFSWHAAKRAVDYRIVVGTTPDPLTTPIFDQVTSAISLTTTFAQPHPTLYWTVFARNDRGETSGGTYLLGIDEAAPDSAVDQARTNALSFERPIPVFWEGEDNPQGVRNSGVRDYDVQVRRPFESEWRDWLSNYADAGEIYASPRYNSVDGQIYCFRTSASDNAGNDEPYGPGPDPDKCITVDPTQRPPQPWWDRAYAAKRALVLLNRLPAGSVVPAQYPVRLRFDAASDPTAAEVVGGSRAGGNDLRVVYNNTKPLSRVITTFRSDLVEIWFPLEAPLADSDQTSYQLYYENVAASDPGYQLSDVLQPRLDPETRLLLYFEEESGSFADASGHNNQGNAVGVVARGEGKFRQGLTLDGRGYVRVNNSPSLQNMNQTLLVEAWVNPSQLDKNTRNIIARLVPKLEDSWRLFTRQEGEIVFDVVAQGGPQVRLTATSKLRVGQWTHIAGVVDGSQVRLFVNGRQEVAQEFRYQLRNSEAWLAVGSTGYDNERFLGTIDQVHVSATPATSFPYAAISSEPSAAAGDEQRQDSGPPIPGQNGNGTPDLAIQSLSAYPGGDGTAIVQVEMVNRGNGVTLNEPVVTIYQDHVPGGPNDFVAAIAHLDHAPLAPGQVATITTRLDLASLQPMPPAADEPAPEQRLSLAAQVDSLGTLPDATRGNNILANIPLCIAPADEFEGDDTQATARSLSLSMTQVHNADVAGDEDWVAFDVVAGQTYRLSTFNLGDLADTSVTIYDTDGSTVLAANDDQADSLAAAASWTAERTGRAYARVVQWSPAAGGCDTTYHLSLTTATELKLAHATAERGSYILVPVSIEQAAGLSAAEFTVTFDKSVLEARGAILGSVAPGWSQAINSSIPGEVRIAMAGTPPGAAPDTTLVLLEFRVIGATGATTPLRFGQVLLNDGAIVPQLVAGSLTVGAAQQISGCVRYWKGNRPIEATRLLLDGDSGLAARSGENGCYTIRAPRGGDYTLTPSKVADATHITAYDASLVLRHVVGLIALPDQALLAADVNQNEKVSASDAALILQHASGRIGLPFPGSNAVWLFNPERRTYTDLPEDVKNQDFTAILLGEVSGNWQGGGAGQQLLAATIPQGAGARLLVGTPESDGVMTTTLLLMPGEAGFFSADVSLAYDPGTISLLSATAGELAEGQYVDIITTGSGRVDVALARTTSVTAEGVLLILRYRVNDGSSAAVPQLTRVLLDEEAVVLAPSNGLRLFLPQLIR